ncbi:MAG: hypothetical protein K0S08_455 [Gammaproteobacteria bacterium]|nr:hypothetical protein [Gammaproteobacteria bacterium]
MFPLIFYNGEKPYLYSTDLFSLFGKNRDIAQSCLLGPYTLINLAKVPDDEIKRHQWVGLMEMVMKHAKVRDVLVLVEEILKTFIEPILLPAQADDYITSMLYYTLNQTQKGNVGEIIELFHKHASKELEGKMTSLAQQLVDKGRQQGIQEGLQQGKAKIIRELVMKLGDKHKVSAILQMSIEELDQCLLEAEKTLHH